MEVIILQEGIRQVGITQEIKTITLTSDRYNYVLDHINNNYTTLQWIEKSIQDKEQEISKVLQEIV